MPRSAPNAARRHRSRADRAREQFLPVSAGGLDAYRRLGGRLRLEDLPALSRKRDRSTAPRLCGSRHNSALGDRSDRSDHAATER
jgi:hypothetical protein